MDVRLRLATSEDAPLIEGMMSRLRAEDPMPRSTLAEGAVALRQLIEDRSLGRAWVIDRGDGAVGYAVLTFCFSLEIGGRIGFVDEIFIEPEHRGSGVGRATLESVVEEASQIGLRALHLEVSPGSRAERLYDRAGFEVRKYGLRTRYLRD